jgi:DNA-binding LacI/PurR family transcriptional regulator
MIDKITLLDQFLRDHQLRGILSICPQEAESELRILADFLHLRVDAIVLIQSILEPAQLRKMLGDALCVHVDPGNQEILPRVSLDRDEAMHLIVNHLVGLGHRSFGTLGFSSLNRTRWKGLTEALQEHAINPDRQLQVFELEAPGTESYAEGIQLAKRALAEKKRPTAFIALNDRVASGAIQELRDAGFQVPEDYSVVGFDNLTVGRHLRPTLTTIDQQPQLLISQAGQLLLQQLGKASGPSLGDHITVHPRLIVRESSGPAPR